MNTALLRLSFAGTLIPALLQAQSITVKSASLRLFEQTSASLLSAEQRVYTAYFNALRTRYIGVEATLEYAPAPESFQLSIGCQMTRPDGRVIDGIWKIGMRIQAGSTSAVAANSMFGAGQEGWPSGVYKVTCAGSRPLGETSFQMSPGPSLLGDTQVRLTGVRFFPTGPQIPARSERNYLDRFSSAEATRIGIELSFVHPSLTQSGEFPIDCYYLSRTGYVLGILNFSYKLEPPATAGTAAMGIGWDQPGRWEKGTYLAVCQIHGRPISVDRFTVW